MYEKISRFMLVSFNLSLRVSSPFKEWRKSFLKVTRELQAHKIHFGQLLSAHFLIRGGVEETYHIIRLAFDVNIILNLSKLEEDR